MSGDLARKLTLRSVVKNRYNSRASDVADCERRTVRGGVVSAPDEET